MRRLLRQRVGVATMLLLWHAPVAAQTSTPATRDSIYRRLLDFRSLVKGGAIEPHWMEDGRSFWYVEDMPAGPTILKVDPAANTVTPLGPAPEHQGKDDASPVFHFVTPATAGAVELPAPGGRWTAVIEEHNIALRRSGDEDTSRLTTDGTERFPWSLTGGSWSPTGASWSPDGMYLLAAKVDSRNVRFMPVVDWLEPNREKVTWMPYAAAGEPIERVELFVLDARSGRQVRVDVGDDPEQYVYPMGWRPDGSEVLFMRFDRLMKRLDLMAADAQTGRSRALVTERQETFVEGQAFNPEDLFFPFADGSRFVWRSERDGWSHLYLYDADGKLLQRLTSGAMRCDGVVAIDEENGWIYYLARGDESRPYDVQVYRVDFKGERASRLTEATGVHSAVFTPGKEYFLDTHSTVERPPRVELRRADGTLVRVLSNADISALEALGWRPPQEFRVKSADGMHDLHGVLYTPHDFDPSRRYPVIDLQYMGNWRHSAPRTFVHDLVGGSTGALGDDAQSLTQLGFVVYIVDARGTPGRSKAFQDLTYRNQAKIEIPDHVAVLRQLAATRPFMDTTRVGITGSSWGGYFTIRALLTAPEVFKVGVAGSPIADFLALPVPFEPYSGLPQENPEGYEHASNVRLADRLRGKLLITIGTADYNTPFSHTMRMAHAFIEAGKFFDLIVLPGETHDLTPSARAYYREARNRYLVEHLRP